MKRDGPCGTLVPEGMILIYSGWLEGVFWAMLRFQMILKLSGGGSKRDGPSGTIVFWDQLVWNPKGWRRMSGAWSHNMFPQLNLIQFWWDDAQCKPSWRNPSNPKLLSCPLMLGGGLEVFVIFVVPSWSQPTALTMSGVAFSFMNNRQSANEKTRSKSAWCSQNELTRRQLRPAFLLHSSGSAVNFLMHLDC